MRMPAPHSSSTQLQKNTWPEHILESQLATKCGMLFKNDYRVEYSEICVVFQSCTWRHCALRLSSTHALRFKKLQICFQRGKCTMVSKMCISVHWWWISLGVYWLPRARRKHASDVANESDTKCTMISIMCIISHSSWISLGLYYCPITFTADIINELGTKCTMVPKISIRVNLWLISLRVYYLPVTRTAEARSMQVRKHSTPWTFSKVTSLLQSVEDP